jgi:hypothetical protein
MPTGCPSPPATVPRVGLLPAGANRQAPAALLELVVEGGEVTKRLLGAPPKLTKRPGHR